MKIFQHFKGGLYTVLHEAMHTETGETMVVYSCNASGEVFCRPLTMFHETVDRDGYKGPRFIEVPYIKNKNDRKKLRLIDDGLFE